MIPDTLQRLHGPQSPTTDVPADIALSAEQARALDEILAALDWPGPRRAIGLFGPRGSGKTLLLNELCKQGFRARHTPQQRKVVCAVINAANLPTDLAPWQRLIFGTLDKLAQQPGAPSTIQDLRAELEEVVQHEANNDESATLAAAAFAHHLRAAFAGLIHSTITLANATFVIAIDHIDKATPEGAMQLLEASRYFLNAQNCAVLICADEAVLVERLGDDAALRAWLTGRVELRLSERPTAHATAHATARATARATATLAPTNAPAPIQRTPPRPIASDIPHPCVQLFAETLGNDRYALERAGDYWRSAMRALARRHAEGYRTDVSGVMIAKLCALRVLSPGLFDAVRFDAPALTTLERRARMQSLADAGSDEWAEVLARDPRLVKLFTAAPSLIGVETRHLATALRLVHTGDAELEHQPQSPTATLAIAETRVTSAPAPAIAAPTPAHPPATPARLDRQQSSQQTKPAELPSPIWSLITVAAGTFIVDRLVKMAVQSIEGFQTGATIFGGLVRLQPPAEIGLIDNGLAVGAELIGLALCILITIFSVKQAEGTRRRAFGLIAGGLAASLFDRLTFGAPMNYLHVANLPVFNLAHLALLAGTLLLAYAVLTDPRRRARNHDTGDLAHE